MVFFVITPKLLRKIVYNSKRHEGRNKNAKRKAIDKAGYHLETDGVNHDIYSSDSFGAMIPVRHSFGDNDLKVVLEEIKQYEKGK